MISLIQNLVEECLLLKYFILPIGLVVFISIGYFFVKCFITEIYFKIFSSRLQIQDGTVILVTGGSNGIGSGVCELLAKNHKGIKLLILDVIENKNQIAHLNKEYNCQVEFVGCDLSNRTQVEESFKKIIQKHNQVDILINNAAVALIEYFETLTIQRFFKAEQINLLSYMQLTQLFLNQPNLQNGKQKQILFMGSVAGFQVGLKTTEYASSKFGLVMFNEALRVELKTQERYKNVKLTIINPYQVDTELFKGFTTLFQKIMPTLNLDKVVNIVYNSLIERRNIVFISWYYEIAIFVVSSLPVWAKDFIGLVTLKSTIDYLQGKKEKFPSQNKQN